MKDKIYDSKTKNTYLLESDGETITISNPDRPEEKSSDMRVIRVILMLIEHKPETPLFKNVHQVDKYLQMFKGGKL